MWQHVERIAFNEREKSPENPGKNVSVNMVLVCGKLGQCWEILVKPPRAVCEMGDAGVGEQMPGYVFRFREEALARVSETNRVLSSQ